MNSTAPFHIRDISMDMNDLSIADDDPLLRDMWDLEIDKVEISEPERKDMFPSYYTPPLSSIIQMEDLPVPPVLMLDNITVDENVQTFMPDIIFRSPNTCKVFDNMRIWKYIKQPVAVHDKF
jgi:hypothetical protein